MMRRFAVFFIFCLAGLNACVGSQTDERSSSGAAAVARVGDTIISARELEEASRDELKSLETQIYEIKQNQLDDLVAQRLFELEARSKGVSIDQLKQEVYAKANIDSGRDLALNQKRRFAERVFVEKLEAKYPVETFLEPPRFQVATEHVPVRGNPEAPVTFVEFSDFQCPYCARVQETIRQLRARYPDQVRFLFKHFPLPMHPDARGAHLASLCAEEQGKFWEYRDLLFQNQRALKRPDLLRYAGDTGLDVETFRSCLESEKYQSRIDRDLEEAFSLGVQGTPAFFINGRFVSGAQPFSEFQKLIDEELKRSGRAKAV